MVCHVSTRVDQSAVAHMYAYVKTNAETWQGFIGREANGAIASRPITTVVASEFAGYDEAGRRLCW